MSNATQGDGIFFLTTGDAIDPVAESAVQASTIQDALSERELYSHRWADAAARTAEVNMKGGDFGFQIDTLTAYVYAGSKYGWRPITFGSSRTLSGSVTVSVDGSGTSFSGTSAVTFPTGFFSQTPFVQTSAYTSNPSSVFSSPNNPSTAGFTVVLKRDNNVATTVYWTAVQN